MHLINGLLFQKVYCGHEYSIQNLKFAQSVDSENKHVQQKLQYALVRLHRNMFLHNLTRRWRSARKEINRLQSRREESLPVPPSTMAEEKEYNPFMRVANASEMKEMREKKNNFK